MDEAQKHFKVRQLADNVKWHEETKVVPDYFGFDLYTEVDQRGIGHLVVKKDGRKVADLIHSEYAPTELRKALYDLCLQHYSDIFE